MSQLDLTGQWSGDYSYPGLIGPTTPFLAKIIEQNGQFTGTIIEPHWRQPNVTLFARIIGVRHAQRIDFTKTYDRTAPRSYRNPVDYVGSLSADGTRITGVWSLETLDGSFEMLRDASQGEEARESIARAAEIEVVR